MENIYDISLVDYVKAIKEKKFSALDGVAFFTEKIAKDEHNAILEVFESAKEQAKIIDEKVAGGKALGKLAGVPIIIKDNILYKEHIASAGSRMLEKFIAPYSATVVEKLLAEDAIILGRANMDEFSMGNTGENSAYGKTHNAFKMGYIAGGSSSGSAVAVAAGLCVAALGTDTGGGLRCPASLNGLFALKPTYGSVSRYGLIAHAGGLEQCGPICKTVEDTELMFNILYGKDFYDRTTLNFDRNKKLDFDVSRLKIAFIKEVWENKDKIEDYDKFMEVFDFYKNNGASIVEISIPILKCVLPAYYIIATAEATSNLSRYDGVKYTSYSKSAKSLEDLYKNTRSEFFGEEVKSRIMLGNFALSSDHFDEYYEKSRQIQQVIREGLVKVFEKCDVLIMPITLSDAVKLGEKETGRVKTYLEDLFTVVANISGIPSMAIPFEKGKNSLPIGFQILTKHFNEQVLFETAKVFRKNWEGKNEC